MNRDAIMWPRTHPVFLHPRQDGGKYLEVVYWHSATVKWCYIVKSLDYLQAYNMCTWYYTCKPFLIPMWEIFFRVPGTELKRDWGEYERCWKSPIVWLLHMFQRCTLLKTHCSQSFTGRDATFWSYINRCCFKFFNFRYAKSMSQTP